MAESAVEICSNALLLLGDSTIASFDEASDRATLAANLWANARRSILRAHPWNCAKKRVVLAPDGTAPAYDWAYQFSLPGDLLRVLLVGKLDEPDEYLIEGRKILFSENALYLSYIFDNTDVASWDAMLVEVAQRYMAFSMAYPLTKSASLRDSMYTEYNNLLRLARTIDGQEEPPETVGDFPLLSARR